MIQLNPSFVSSLKILVRPFKFRNYSHLLLLEPSSIRLITDKNTKKSKGFAFVEFNSSKYLEVPFPGQCNHISNAFQAALSKDQTKLKGRKVNIELTAGGGGNKSAVRNERIKSKNEKLKEELNNKKSEDGENKKKKPKLEKMTEREGSYVNQDEGY